MFWRRSTSIFPSWFIQNEKRKLWPQLCFRLLVWFDFNSENSTHILLNSLGCNIICVRFVTFSVCHRNEAMPYFYVHFGRFLDQYRNLCCPLKWFGRILFLFLYWLDHNIEQWLSTCAQTNSLESLDFQLHFSIAIQFLCDMLLNFQWLTIASN